MIILCDICHPAHVNFFKPTIYRLTEEGHKVIITGLDRGNLMGIIKKEFKDYKIFSIGRHRGTFLSIIFEANISKFIGLFKLCIKQRPDVGLSAGSFVLSAILKIMYKKSLIFDDDPERKINVLLEKMTTNRIFFPLFLKQENRKFKRYNSLKEWSYLSPKYFNPDRSILNGYNLVSKEYIFIREVSTGSLNYIKQEKAVLSTITDKIPKHLKVVLSLEDKSRYFSYPSDWIILKEPVTNIHTLIYYSRLLISSGDSMAREGSVLGVPSIYCGLREMLANKVMQDMGMLFHIKPKEVPEAIDRILKDQSFAQNQDDFRNKLLLEWIDVNELICSEVMNLRNS